MKSEKQILIKIFMPMVITTIISSILISIYITSETKNNIITNSTNYAINTIKQYKILRQYYTKYVVEKINTKINVNYVHKGIENTIPLPATMIKDVSALIHKENNDIEVSLYSEFAFPHSQNRILDDFSKRALLTFKNNPSEKNIIEIQTMNNKKVLRVAIADIMTQNTCVQCHNTRLDSPKRDWKLGDVRGVLEVIVPMDKELDLAEKLNIKIIILILLLVCIMMTILYIYFKKNILKPYKHLYDQRKNMYK